MTSKQLFGYTPPGPAEGENYVRYLMVFEADDGGVEVHARDSDGKVTVVQLPAKDRLELLRSLLG